MKKLLVYTLLSTALASCGLENIDKSSAYFEKGQLVNITVNAGISTKVSSAYNEDEVTVDFKWNTGDKIKVTVEGQSEEFTLKKGANENTATFEGKMPQNGNTFSVQFPVDTPDLTSQVYSSEVLPKDKMLFVAENCNINEPFTLNPAYAALRLNLWSGKKVGKIVITNITSADPKPTYTLDCGTGAATGSSEDETTPFCIVVPAGESRWNFMAEIYSETDTYLCRLKKTSTDKYFTVGEILDMPAKKVYQGYPGTDEEPITIEGVTWAPVNCGYDENNYKWGKLYQWGRACGCGYKEQGISSYNETVIQISITGEFINYINRKLSDDNFNSYFYKRTTDPNDWYASNINSMLSIWPTSNEGIYAGKIGNPCPKGWRVPTKTELMNLKGDKPYANKLKSGKHGSISVPGLYFDGTSTASSSSNPVVFLPAAGCRNFNDGYGKSRGSYGLYWTCTTNVSKAWALEFKSEKLTFLSSGRAGGCSVRCVKEQ